MATAETRLRGCDPGTLSHGTGEMNKVLEIDLAKLGSSRPRMLLRNPLCVFADDDGSTKTPFDCVVDRFNQETWFLYAGVAAQNKIIKRNHISSSGALL